MFLVVSIILYMLHMHAACTQGDIRLVGGARDREGRVEVCNQNLWGSVCDVSWDINDANVACRQAGFGSGMYYNTTATYSLTVLRLKVSIIMYFYSLGSLD